MCRFVLPPDVHDPHIGGLREFLEETFALTYPFESFETQFPQKLKASLLGLWMLRRRRQCGVFCSLGTQHGPHLLHCRTMPLGPERKSTHVRIK